MNNKQKLMRISYGIYFLIAMFFVAIRMLSAFGLLNFLGDFSGVVFTIVVQIFLLAAGSIFLFSAISKNKVKDTLNYFNFKKISTKAVITCVILGVVVFFLNVFASSFFNSIISFLGYSPNRTSSVVTEYPVWLLFVNIIFTAVLPGICEEIAHRGMILSSSQAFGSFKAILISSFLFGLLHLNIEQFFYATLIGIFLGYLTHATGSIYPAMIVHFMNNALSVFLTFSSVNGLAFANIFIKLELILQNNWFIGILFIILFVIILLYILYRLTFYLIFTNAKQNLLKSSKELEKVLKKRMYFNELNSIKGKEENLSNKILLNKEELGKIFDFLPKKEKFKKDCFALCFLSLSISIMTIITIFTFIWGVL